MAVCRGRGGSVLGERWQCAGVEVAVCWGRGGSMLGLGRGGSVLG